MNFWLGLILLANVTLALSGCKHVDSSEVNTKKERVQNNVNYYQCALYDSAHTVKIPFALYQSHEQTNGRHVYYIQNGSEKITLETLQENADSVALRFPVFHSVLILYKQGDKLQGYWDDPSRDNYRMLVRGQQAMGPQNFVGDSNTALNGKWETRFSPGEPYEYPAIGMFNNNDGTMLGTFLTETGDFRFLWGYIKSDSLVLSCFDGSHAFKFAATLKNDTLHGVFISGNHYYEPWVAWKNENATLTHPDSLTRLKSTDLQIEISGFDVTGRKIQFPGNAYTNKVVLVQVMASWCPNCYDETAYLAELYKKYNQQGLEIIALAFERGTNEQATERILHLAAHHGATYPFIISGDNKKTTAEALLKQLDQVKSFPTLIFIDRANKIRKIHTGFYGPGTGALYEQFVSENTHFVETLLKE